MQEQTVERLYRCHAAAIQAHCSRLLGGRDGAGDALQETFVRALGRSEPPLSDEHAVRSLFRISTHVCIDALRQRKVRARAHHDLAQLAHAQAAQFRDEAAGDAVAKLLSRCDERTRAIAALHFIDGERHTAIARRVGISRRTVHGRLKRLAQIAAEIGATG
jgi:RNA polymerase sigma-70 factor, ECF subfamily